MRLLFTILFASVFTLTYGQIPDSLSGKIDAIFAEYQKPNSPGCALAILKDGKIIYQRGYGISNLEYNIPISPTSIFHIASISKQFTAAAILKLVELRKLKLTDPLSTFFKNLPIDNHRINSLSWVQVPLLWLENRIRSDLVAYIY